LRQIRSSFKENAKVEDPQKVEALVQKAQSSLEFLQMKTPPVRRGKNTGKSGHFVLKDGKVVEGYGKARDHLDYVDPRVDATQMARHEQLLRRQYFMEAPPPIDKSKKWF
jgi:hypothetical protein